MNRPERIAPPAGAGSGPRGAEAADGAVPAPLRRVLDGFDAAGLRYCRWSACPAPDTPPPAGLGLLVERGRSAEIQRILAAAGTLRIADAAGRGLPAAEEHLAFDDATGRLLHLVLHHRLALRDGDGDGPAYLPPWDEDVLATRRVDPGQGLPRPAAAAERLILLVHAALRPAGRDLQATLRRVQGTGAAETAETVALGARLIGPGAEPPLRRLLAEGAAADMRAFAALARPALAPYRTGRGQAGARPSRADHAPGRVSPRGGLVIAFLGPDGSGKSTLCADTAAWLGTRLDTHRIYFGSGDGPGSLLRAPLRIARHLVDRRAPSATPQARRSGWRGRLRAAALIPWALTLGLEKRQKLRRLVRARNRGAIVVCDRYPQDRVAGFNDGRLLAHLAGSRSRLLRRLAAHEAVPYARAMLDPPDIAIKLLPSPQVARARRPEMSRDDLERRLAAVRALRFPPRTRVAEIDADQPLDAVRRQIRKLVWESL